MTRQKRLEMLRQPVENGTEALLTLHRGDDGYIAAVRDANFTKPEYYRAGDLLNWFPEFIQAMFRDCYVTINSFKTPWRKGVNVKYLCACYADLDCHNLGITTGQALGAIVDMVGDGVLPQPSLTIHSGRGVWPLWCLCDEKGLPLIADYASRRLYSDVEHVIRDKLADLGADPAATDAARYCRSPSSWNSRAQDGKGAAVVWDVHFVTDPYAMGLETPLYTLPDLAVKLGMGALAEPVEVIRPRALPPPKERKPVAVGERRDVKLDIPERQKKHAAVWVKRLADLRSLLVLRGGLVPIGERQTWAYTWYHCLRRCPSVTIEQAYASTKRLVEEHFEQPSAAGDQYTEKNLERLVKDYGNTVARAKQDAKVAQRLRWRSVELAARLGVTDEEARHLDSIITQAVKDERAAEKKASTERRQNDRQKAREDAEKILRGNPDAGLRQVAKELERSHEWVRQVRKELGITPNERGGPRRGGRRR